MIMVNNGNNNGSTGWNSNREEGKNEMLRKKQKKKKKRKNCKMKIISLKKTNGQDLGAIANKELIWYISC